MVKVRPAWHTLAEVLDLHDFVLFSRVVSQFRKNGPATGKDKLFRTDSLLQVAQEHLFSITFCGAKVRPAWHIFAEVLDFHDLVIFWRSANSFSKHARPNHFESICCCRMSGEFYFRWEMWPTVRPAWHIFAEMSDFHG